MADSQQPKAAAGGATLAEKLGDSRVGLRPELQFTRHLFQGRVSYIVRDPITFDTHRLPQDAYEILICLRPDRPLRDHFRWLVEQKKLTLEEEESFYEFIFSLHRLGFLQLPIADGERLYRRHVEKKRQKIQKRFLGIFFAQIPLFNPDAFLDWAMRFVRPIFTRTFFVMWTAVVGLGAVAGALQWESFYRQLDDLGSTGNLILLWVVTIVLKAFHEAGHGFACKRFGGVVPETGVSLIVLTPCAYVDASASWGFPRKIDRLIVCMAGMYVELFIAALALFVWASTPPGLLNTVAHQVVFLAGITTVGFNVNPLMKFDGYYALSDVLEIPNLRQHASQAAAALLKRWTVGLAPKEEAEEAPLIRALLVAYGTIAGLYRAIVVLSMSALIATKFFVVGVFLGAFYCLMELAKTLRAVLKFLWWSKETAACRRRATAVGVVALIVPAAALFLLPIPARVTAEGRLRRENEATLRVEVPGVLEKLHALPGETVREGAAFADLSDPSMEEAFIEAQGKLARAEFLERAYRGSDPVKSRKEAETARFISGEVELRRAAAGKLRMRAPAAGHVVEALTPDHLGRYLVAGTPVGMIASGDWEVEVLLSGEQIAAVRSRPGDRVTFRPSQMGWARFDGTVARVDPAGDQRVRALELTRAGGGAIAVDARTLEAPEPYFTVSVTLDPVRDAALFRGMTGTVHMEAASEVLAVLLGRKLRTFLDRLKVR